MTTTEPPRRPAATQSTLTVRATSRLSPHLVRVVLGDAEPEHYADAAWADTYLKLYFVAPGTDPELPIDLRELGRTMAPEQLPSRRTYTVRAYDPAVKELTIDFVVHGDEGVAGPWAEAAEPGDTLVATPAYGAYSPDPAADRHVLLGDESAIPAIARALEQLPADAVGVAAIEVDGDDDELDLAAPEGVEVRWLHRAGRPAGGTGLLADTLRALPWPQDDVHVFAHGERGEIKALRPLLAELGVPRERLSISGYWAAGRTEDRFQAEKREPIGQI